mgnify:CR=1 FL=1
MKKLIIAFCLIAISLSATAQYADKDIIVKRGKLYCDGIQLTHQQSLDYFSNVTGEDRTQDYLQYTRDFKIGKQMEIWGDKVIESGDFDNRVLELAIPEGVTNSQLEQLKRLKEYAQEQNIQLTIVLAK